MVVETELEQRLEPTLRLGGGRYGSRSGHKHSMGEGEYLEICFGGAGAIIGENIERVWATVNFEALHDFYLHV